MQQCPNCGQVNRAGVVFCEFCGASLIGKQPLDTKSLDSKEEAVQKQYGVDANALTDVRVQGAPRFEEGDRLRLEIEGCPDPLFFELEQEAIFGRKDPATGAMPDIDLTPYAGYRMGVSRRHAAISRNAEHGLDVRDLGSSNGTFLNGQQLVAHRLYRLRNGDELRLGQMVIRVLFEPVQVAQAVSEEGKHAAAPSANLTPAKTLTTERPKQLTDEAGTSQGEKAQTAAPAQVAPSEARPKPEPQTDAAAQPQEAKAEKSGPSSQPAQKAQAQPADSNAEEEVTEKPKSEKNDKRD